MKTNEKIQNMIKIHTRVVTGILLLNCLYLFWLPDNPKIGIIDIVGIQLIGLISAVAYLPLMTEKELSKKRMIFYNILYCLTINISVLVVGYFFKWFSFEYKWTILAVEFMFIAVYIIMMLINYKLDNNQAIKMNKKLQERNKKLLDEEKY